MLILTSIVPILYNNSHRHRAPFYHHYHQRYRGAGISRKKGCKNVKSLGCGGCKILARVALRRFTPAHNPTTQYICLSLFLSFAFHPPFLFFLPSTSLSSFFLLAPYSIRAYIYIYICSPIRSLMSILYYSLLVLCGLCAAVMAQQNVPTVDDNGFKDQTNQPDEDNQSWLEKHDRYIFIIVIGILLLSLLIWYIVRSVRGMRKRLARENEQMMQPPPPYYNQPISEAVTVPMSGYQKLDTPAASTAANGQVQYTHRY